MPQLDLYTFPTQIYFIAVFFFFCFIYVIKLLYTLYFKYELLEAEEIHTIDNIFLITVGPYLESQLENTKTLLPIFDKFLVGPAIHE
jgi:hypothetical protein